MGEEGKNCFFSYLAKAELPPWIIHVRSCSAILSRISNHPSAEFLYCSSNQLLRTKFDQLPEITSFVCLAEYCFASRSLTWALVLLILGCLVHMYLYACVLFSNVILLLLFKLILSSVALISIVPARHHSSLVSILKRCWILMVRAWQASTTQCE